MHPDAAIIPCLSISLAPRSGERGSHTSVGRSCRSAQVSPDWIYKTNLSDIPLGQHSVEISTAH